MAAPGGDRPVALCQSQVTLTLEVAACANIYSTVYAKAWVDQITIHNAVDLAPLLRPRLRLHRIPCGNVLRGSGGLCTASSQVSGW
jgi:hypothetical protein